MIYGKSYIARNSTYSSDYIADSLYGSIASLIPCPQFADFFYNGESISNSEMVDLLDSGYVLEITDNLGNKLPDGAQPIPTNYIKFKEDYPTLVANDTTNVFFDAGGQAKTLLIGDIERLINDQYFFTFDESGKIVKIGLYKEVLTDPCLSNSQDFFQTRVDFVTSDGENFVTSDGEHFHVVPE